MTNYKLDGNYPSEKTLNEPHLNSSHINLDEKQFANSFIFKIETVDYGKNETFGEYMTMWLKCMEINKLIKKDEIGVRKTVNIGLNKYNELSRDTKILAEMFKIDNSENWKTIIGQEIACILTRRMDRNRKEIRNKEGFILIGIKILSPHEFAELEASKIENRKDIPSYQKSEPLPENKKTYFEEPKKEIPKEEPKGIVIHTQKCTKCGKAVKAGFMEQHIDFGCKMFTV